MDSINGTDYTSNLAEVDWQATNGAIAVAGVTVNIYSCNPSGSNLYSGVFPSKIEGPLSGNSIVFNERTNGSPITGFVSPDGNSGAYKLTPPVWLQQNAAGAWTSNITFSSVNSGNNEAAQYLIQGYLVVPKAASGWQLSAAHWSWCNTASCGRNLHGLPSNRSQHVPERGMLLGKLPSARCLSNRMRMGQHESAGILPAYVVHSGH